MEMNLPYPAAPGTGFTEVCVLFCLCDGPAAKEEIAIVKDDGLPRRGCALRLVKYDPDPSGRKRGYNCLMLNLMVSGADRGADRLRRLGDGQPVNLRRNQLTTI